MNWNDPAERARLIERVGPDEYGRLQKAAFEKDTVETINGYPIRRVVSGRFGPLFMVDGTGHAHQTLEGARQIALSAPKLAPEAT